MANKTSLMEWLEQTKRLSKEEDYMALEIIDTVMEHIHAVCPELIRKHRKFFNKLCDEYHKPNPVVYLKKNHLMKEFKKKHGVSFNQWQASFCRIPKGYPSTGCRAFKFFRKAMTEQLEIQIERSLASIKVMEWQWFEIIDFMYERPELVNPALIDPYITTKITEVCAEHKKNNPLLNGMRLRFGKFWKDAKGKWIPERRRHF